jgi:Na+/H+ antiporter NhaD/arsenite permease-like protein
MIAFTIVALVVVALVGGLFVHRRFAERRSDGSDVEGLSITDIAGVIPTMSVLLLAFIMVATFDSWKTAGDTATDEGNTVVELARAARFLPNEGGAPIARLMTCYTRSVEHVEWDLMADGHASNLPDYWGDRTSHAIEDARDDDENIAFELLPLDRERISARQVRLEQSTPSVPAPMSVLMIASVVLSVFFLAMLTHVSIRRPVQLAALVGAAVLLGASLLLIEEMDSPYAGLTKIEPTAMDHAAKELVDELAEYSTRQPPPCDKHGLPKTDGWR